MMNWQRHSLAASLSCSLVIAGAQVVGIPAMAQTAASPQVAVAPPVSGQRFDAGQLDQLVAPIALYPDALVAQVLAASAYPVEIVEAERWMPQHADLHGEALAQAVDKESWDPSVKALTQFPSVLANMDQNLAWTSALGDAYVNQEPAVLDAVQVMRQRAQAAGNLKSTSQQTVTTSGQTIVIEPADPQTVYLPQYDPWQAYGAPVAVYPGWAPYTGLYVNEPGIYFGLGLGLGLFAGVGWGWHHWGADWHDHRLMHDRAPYVAHSAAFGFHGGGVPAFHGGGVPRPDVIRGGTAPHGMAPHGMAPGLHSGAFSGVNHGGVARANSFRGQSSFGGGFHGGGAVGGFHGGGGGFHGGGGGFHGGGGHR